MNSIKSHSKNYLSCSLFDIEISIAVFLRLLLFLGIVRKKNHVFLLEKLSDMRTIVLFYSFFDGECIQ